MSLSKPKNYCEMEAYYAIKGKFKKIAVSDSAYASLRVRYEKSDARKAEALARADSKDKLQLLKALLNRGEFDECKSLLSMLKELRGQDLELDAEVILQEARYEYLIGNWENSIRLCTLLETHPSVVPLNKMALYQVRSNAFFECARFDESLIDYNRVASLSSLFSHGQLPLYAQTNRVRIECRLLGADSVMDDERKLWKMWRLNLESSNLDPLLTLLRARIEILRFQGKDFLAEAIAAYRVAEKMGDDLYQSLALFDCVVANGAIDPIGTLMIQLQSASRRHLRVANLVEEVFADNAPFVSETAQAIKRYLQKQRSGPILEIIPAVNEILLLHLGVKINLESVTVERVELQSRSVELLSTIQNTPKNKDELFQKIWNLPKFVPELHDSVIRTAVSRAREQSKIEIRSAQTKLLLGLTTLVLSV